MNERPSITVDCVLFAEDGGVVLIKRANEPFRGCYALPGGYLENGETVEEACAREAKEEIGVLPMNLRLIGVYSNPKRDPRRHTVTVAFLGDANLTTLRAGDDASHVEVVKDWRSASIAFDHTEIIKDAWLLLQSNA